MMTPTASLADIFLPVNTPWEREALRVGFEGSQAAANLIQFRQAVTESAGESRSDAFIVFELAKRLGFGDLFWDGDVDAGLNHMLAPLHLTLDDLRAQPGGVSVPGDPLYYQYQKSGFKTHTGKVEIFSEVFRDAGQTSVTGFRRAGDVSLHDEQRRISLGADLRQARAILSRPTSQRSFVAPPRR